MRRDDDSILPVLLGAILVAGVLAAGYYFLNRQTDAPVEHLRLPPAQSVPGQATGAPSAIEHPVEQAEVAEKPDAASDSPPAEPPPPESETTFMQALERVVGAAPLQDYFVLDDFVEHLVVTIDNLPNEKLPRRVVPVRPLAGEFAASGDAAEVVLGDGDYARYAPYVTLLRTLDMKALATAYVRHYGSFQQAYATLGYPDAYFNDRLVAVIDHLLATPDVPAPVKLVRPGVRYKFADPDLEARSAGQKALIRMGSANAAIVKTRLREFRQLVTRPASE